MKSLKPCPEKRAQNRVHGFNILRSTKKNERQIKTNGKKENHNTSGGFQRSAVLHHSQRAGEGGNVSEK